MEFLETIVLVGVPVVLAITLHEAAHGYVAKLFGDRTAEMLGRVTLNPIKHVDPVGTILVPGALWLLAKMAGGVPSCSAGRSRCGELRQPAATRSAT